MKVTRDYWYEVWPAPDGHEVMRELKQQGRSTIFPPLPTCWVMRHGSSSFAVMNMMRF